MTQAGASKDYSGKTKSQWRGWVWNRIRERVPPEKDTTILYLLGPSPIANDVREAVKRGYNRYNLIGIDNNRGNVLAARADGLLAVQGDIDRVVMSWPDDWKVHGVIADFCGGLSRQVMAYIYAVQIRDAFDPCVLITNMLKGRDAYANSVRHVVEGMQERLTAKLECLTAKRGKKAHTTRRLPKRSGARNIHNRNRDNNTWKLVLESTRILAVIGYLGRTSVSYYDAGGLDCVSYRSGNLVYETCMVAYKRMEHDLEAAIYDEIFTSMIWHDRPDGTREATTLRETLEAHQAMCRMPEVEEIDHAKIQRATGSDTIQMYSVDTRELAASQQKEQQHQKRIRRQLGAIRAHQTRRKKAS